jgi:8-oxo-dGTP pyrophosphatase MutT (NUDIX family)
MAKKYTDEQNKQWQASLPKKKDAVKVIVKSNKGNILLVKPDYKDTWQLLGGGVEANEDPKAAAIRESKEEASIDINPGELEIIGTAFKPDEDYLFLIYEYKKTVDEDTDYSVEDEEIEGYRFVSPEGVAGLLPNYYKDFWNAYSS